MSSRYWELTVPTSDDAAEGLTNFLWELGALGVVEEAAAGCPARLRAFFPEATAPAALPARVRDYLDGLAALGFAVAGMPHLSPVTDENWAEAWRAHFEPFPVGRSLMVAPPWEHPPANGRTVLTIEPGRAFGTGQHGSTLGCLIALETIFEEGPTPARMLDLGTGSGILAVAAARLGAESVLAVDSDPDAIAAAVANAARNGVADRVHCLLGDAHELASESAPLVVANLLTAAHLALAARYTGYVTVGGRLVVGGILDEEADAVATALGTHGFSPTRTTSVEGWTTLVGRR